MFDIISSIKVFREVAGISWRYRALVFELTRRDIVGRYAGQWLGVFWAFGHPIIMMGVYVFVFSVIFQLRLESPSNTELNYTTYLLSALIPWFAAQTVMVSASSVITSNSELVKQVLFPLELLPLKAVLSALFTEVVFVGALILYGLLVGQTNMLAYLLLIPLGLLQLLFFLGLGYGLACISPFFRDIKDIVQVISMIGFYASPIFYTPSIMGSGIIGKLFYLNPFSYMVWSFRDVLFYGTVTNELAWAGFIIISIITLPVGYRLFRKTSLMFGNVL